MRRLQLLLTVLVLALGVGGQAKAASSWVDYSPAVFSEAQAAGKKILVDVSADWCPTCKAQEPILNELAGEESMQGVLFVRVDFDTQKDFLREHRIPRQSTIVVFNGTSEVNRSIAETNRDRLRQFVLDAVQQ